MVKYWKKWCRLCAREDSSNTHINVFLEHNEMLSLGEIINKYFSIKIEPDDDWPQSICTKCHQLIITLLAFVQRASRVQMMFAELFNSWQKLEATQLKIQYSLHEPDDKELKFTLAIGPAVQSYEPEENIYMGITEEMIDIKEVGYIEEKMQNPITIKTENSDDDGQEVEYKNVLVSPAYRESRTTPPNSTKNVSEELKPTPIETSGKPVLRPKAETFTCSECNSVYTRYTNYRNHMKIQHGITLEPAQFSCTKCNKIFYKAWRLREHANSHLPLEQKLNKPCPQCDKKFSQTIRLQAHIRSKHLGLKSFVCEQCGKKCKNFVLLNEHRMSHTDETPFKCTSCDKRFKNKYKLKIHEDTHSDNFICTICGMQLNTRRTLSMHMVVHSDQKRYKCDYCGNEYKRSKALKNHLILHTGLKPYTCNFCEKSFANGSNCRSHKKKAHPVELAAMEAAGKKTAATNIPNLKELRAVTSSKKDFSADGDSATSDDAG